MDFARATSAESTEKQGFRTGSDLSLVPRRRVPSAVLGEWIFLQDELNFLRNIQIFKKNSAKYCVKYISQDLMASIPVRLTKHKQITNHSKIHPPYNL